MATPFFLLVCIFIYITKSFFPDEIEEIREAKRYVNPKQYLFTKFDLKSLSTTTNDLTGGDTGLLTVSSNIINSADEWITVSWWNVSYTGKYDWIGLFNASAQSTAYASPPIKYQYICPAVDGCYYAPSSGSLKFQILNRRTSYIFAYITESNPYREIKGVTPIVSYNNDNTYLPMNVHLATPTNINNCGISNSCMQIMWIQKAINQPQIKYGTQKNKLSYNILAADTYHLKSSDFCNNDEGLPAGTSGYFDTGYMITGYLLTLQANVIYYYQVGDDKYGYTQIYNFTSPPLYGTMTPRNDLKMIIFGDMGNVAIDYSMHHSWDFNNRGEIYSINTSNTINLYTNGTKDITDAVIHIGDISYAVGFLSEWDDFFHIIEPVSSQIPWMTGMGNHEYSWLGEWKPPSFDVSTDAYGNADGGGECGVPYNFYFPFANINQTSARNSNYNPSIVEPWYIFDYGTVRTIIMSTEHDFGINSAQWKFINNTLYNTNRSIFAWIFLAGHRPMYANDDWDGDLTTSSYLRDSLEKLINDNNVALAFWGHQHSYGRTCSVYNETCGNDGEYTVHLIVGMAGYSLSKSVTPMNYIRFQNNTIYGFVHLTIQDNTKLIGKFIDANTTNIVDQFTIINPYKS